MRKRVLLIDDDKDLVRLVRRRLGNEGYDVVSSSDAETGLQLVRKNAPDIILLDIHLPKMSGLSLLRVLRKECRVPVIVISGRSSDADRIIGLNAGANDYIVKPFSLGELVARIDCHLRKEMRFDARNKPAV